MRRKLMFTCLRIIKRPYLKAFISITVLTKNNNAKYAIVNDTFDGQPIMYFYAAPAKVGLRPKISAVFKRPSESAKFKLVTK